MDQRHQTRDPPMPRILYKLGGVPAFQAGTRNWFCISLMVLSSFRHSG